MQYVLMFCAITILNLIFFRWGYRKGKDYGVYLVVSSLDHHGIISMKELDVILEALKNGTYKGRKP